MLNIHQPPPLTDYTSVEANNTTGGKQHRSTPYHPRPQFTIDFSGRSSHRRTTSKTRTSSSSFV